MSDVKMCDACGVIFDSFSTVGYEKNAIKFKKIRTIGVGRDYFYDTCPACAMKLAEFFKIVGDEEKDFNSLGPKKERDDE